MKRLISEERLKQDILFLSTVCLSSILIKDALLGAGEMAQQLRALTALLEVLSSVPSKHMVAHSIKGSDALFWREDLL